MHDVGITIEELSKSWMMIHGFNLKGQYAIRVIRVILVMSNLSTSSIFHVIDAKTSYNSLGGHGSINTGLFLLLYINA